MGDQLKVYAPWAEVIQTGVVSGVTEFRGKDYYMVQILGSPPGDLICVRSLEPGELYRPCSPPWKGAQ